jgi:transcriptional regulator with XRE-family HTH domain
MRALRVALKVSLRQVQQLTGLDRGHLSRLERGLAGAGPETIRRYAAALDVPTAAITHAPHPAYPTHDITSGVAGDVPHDGKV